MGEYRVLLWAIPDCTSSFIKYRGNIKEPTHTPKRNVPISFIEFDAGLSFSPYLYSRLEHKRSDKNHLVSSLWALPISSPTSKLKTQTQRHSQNFLLLSHPSCCHCPTASLWLPGGPSTLQLLARPLPQPLGSLPDEQDALL